MLTPIVTNADSARNSGAVATISIVLGILGTGVEFCSMGPHDFPDMRSHPVYALLDTSFLGLSVALILLGLLQKKYHYLTKWASVTWGVLALGWSLSNAFVVSFESIDRAFLVAVVFSVYPTVLLAEALLKRQLRHLFRNR